MPLHNLERSANAVPHIRYMAGTASWMLSTDEGMQTIQLPQCLFDFGKIKTGWGCFQEDQAPEWVWDPSLEQQVPKPNDGREWKKGFHVLVMFPQEYAPFQVREFATTGVGAVEGIKGLYAQYEQGAAQNPGKVPLVQYVGATPNRYEQQIIWMRANNMPWKILIDEFDKSKTTLWRDVNGGLIRIAAVLNARDPEGIEYERLKH